MIEYGLLAGGIGGVLAGVLDAFGHAGDLAWQAASDHPLVALGVAAAVLFLLFGKRR